MWVLLIISFVLLVLRLKGFSVLFLLRLYILCIGKSYCGWRLWWMVCEKSSNQHCWNVWSCNGYLDPTSRLAIPIKCKSNGTSTWKTYSLLEELLKRPQKVQWLKPMLWYHMITRPINGFKMEVSIFPDQATQWSKFQKPFYQFAIDLWKTLLALYLFLQSKKFVYIFLIFFTVSTCLKLYLSISNPYYKSFIWTHVLEKNIEVYKWIFRGSQ